jgi:hypothetical protein
VRLVEVVIPNGQKCLHCRRERCGIPLVQRRRHRDFWAVEWTGLTERARVKISSWSEPDASVDV